MSTVALGTIAHLDFDPVIECDGCEEAAGYRLRLVCGCVGMFCLRCLKAFKQGIRLCEDYAKANGAEPFWDCVDCLKRMWGHPIAEIRAL